MTTDLVPIEETGLERDPVEFMAVALNRAKGWLSEAASIEDVREARAIAVGYESVIREKELAFDAQLSATEIVRRCERRIGQLVRQGQQDGTVLRRGQVPGRDSLRDRNLLRPSEAMGVAPNSDAIFDSYAMAEAAPEQFEQALTEARDEGNLSRANVVRKVKGEQPKSNGRSEWHHNRRHIDSDRILSTLAGELDAATSGLELIEADALDPDLRDECVASIHRSIKTINTLLRRLK